MSLLLPPRLGFEASTLEMVKFNTCNGKLCMLFYTRAQVRNFLWSLEGQICISPQWPKRHQFSKLFDTKYGQNVTLAVPQIWFWAFNIWNCEKCSIPDTRASLGATKVTFWPDFVLIVLKNWRLLSISGLIFDLLRLIKRS